MLLIKTKLGSSKINGIGLFAAQFIPRGTTVWKFQPGFDIRISKEELVNLSEPANERFLHYCYLNINTHKYILSFDDARFFNHSDRPNCIGVASPYDEEGFSVAGKDIKEGEELTCNYKVFDADFDYKMKSH